MDNSTQTYIAAFLAQYDTFAIATEYEVQPYVMRVFYVDGPMRTEVTVETLTGNEHELR